MGETYRVRAAWRQHRVVPILFEGISSVIAECNLLRLLFGGINSVYCCFCQLALTALLNAGYTYPLLHWFDFPVTC